MYRVRQDGTQAVRVTAQPISGFRGVSPDERSVMVIVSVGREAMTAAAILPLNGDSPVLVCVRCYTNLDPAGKFLYVSSWDSPDTETYVLPVRQDNWLPESLRNEPLRAQDMTGILGARRLNATEIPIANATVSPAPTENK